MAGFARTDADAGGRVAAFVTAPFRPQTYRNLAYLLLAFPLGLAYFVFVTVGLSVGVGMAVLVVGIPIIAATVAGALGVGGVERRLTAWLLGVEVPGRTEVDGETRRDRLWTLATDRRTWGAVVYLPVKFAVGTVALVFTMNALVTGVALLTVPLYYTEPGLYVGIVTDRPVELHPALHVGWNRLLVGLETVITIDAWRVRTLPEALVVAGAGLLLLLVGLSVLNWLAGAHGRLTERLLAGGYDPVGAAIDDE